MSDYTYVENGSVGIVQDSAIHVPIVQYYEGEEEMSEYPVESDMMPSEEIAWICAPKSVIVQVKVVRSKSTEKVYGKVYRVVK